MATTRRTGRGKAKASPAEPKKKIEKKKAATKKTTPAKKAAAVRKSSAGLVVEVEHW